MARRLVQSTLMMAFGLLSSFLLTAHAATVTVTLNSDSTNTCATSGAAPCSFRDAIVYANATPTVDTIAFNIGGGGAQTISLATALPTVANSNPLLIDASTQPGFAGTPLITLTTALTTIPYGLQLANNVTLKAMAIGAFSAVGVRISGSGNTLLGNHIGLNAAGTAALSNGINVQIASGGNNRIGGLGAGERNVISASNSAYGIQVQGTGGNTIQGNYLGTDITGNIALGNRYDGLNIASSASGNTVDRNLISGNNASANANPGLNIDSNNNTVTGNLVGTNAAGTAAVANLASGISISGSNNIIGGSAAADRNILSGNGTEGLRINSGNNNQIIGNYIGVNVNGDTALSNYNGIVIFAGNGNIARNNVISGNPNAGIAVQGTASGAIIQGNKIGTDLTGVAAIPNGAGVAFFQNAVNSTVGGTAAGEGNVIAMNAIWGIALYSSGNTGNSFLGNSIFGQPGIAFAAGANHDQVAPVLTSVTSTLVTGTLTSTPSRTFRIEYFTTPKVNGVAAAGQGKTFLGFQNVTTDGSGNAVLNFSGTIPEGVVVTAIATNQTSLDSSRFSTQATFNTAPVAQAQTLSTAMDVPLSITLAATDADGDTLTYAIATNPAHGVLSGLDLTTGAVTYTPTAGYLGPDSFTFTANDGTATSAPATVSITVTGNPPPPPPANNIPIPALDGSGLALLAGILLLAAFLYRRRFD